MKNTILIGSSSFGMSERAVEMLEASNIRVVKPAAATPAVLENITGIIAGTELYGEAKLATMPNLKVLSRMGVGLDEIDLQYCAAHGITVTYTPYGPTKSVAQITIGYMIMLLRNIHLSNLEMHRQRWIKTMGRQFSEVNIGILGAGRIGSEVIRLLTPFGPKQIYACDTDPSVIGELFSRHHSLEPNVKFVGLQELFFKCDLVSLHIPLGKQNHHLINKDLLNIMSPSDTLINTSRGALVNENDLYSALVSNRLGGAAIDVFEQEPYDGFLSTLSHVIMGPHISSMTLAARNNMEVGAVTDCLRVLENNSPIHEVDYEL